MQIIYATPDKPMCIGREGENKTTQVMIPLSGLLSGIREKTYTLIVQLPSHGQGESYTPELTEITPDGKYLIWTLTLADLQSSGRRKAEIKATDGHSVEISRPFTFTVSKSLDNI